MEMNNMKQNSETPPPVERKCTPWGKRTNLERALIVVCIAIFVAFLSMAAVVLYLEHIYTRPKPRICDTTICRRTAGRMMSIMDFDADPCEDFYNFSCGSFPKTVEIPSGVNRYGPFYMANERLRRVTEDVLETEEEEDDPDFVKKVKQYYKACMNLDTETSFLIEQILNISEIYRWPILEHDYYEDYQLVEKTMALLKINQGENGFFQMYSTGNDTVQQFSIYPGSVFGEKEMFLNDTDESCTRKKEAYRSLLTYSFFKAGTQLEAIETEVDELIQFEILLANITSEIGIKENVTDTTLKNMTEECKKVEFTKYVKDVYAYFGHLDDYSDEIQVKLSGKTYFDNLCELFGRSRKRIIYNYLVWRFLADELRNYDLYFGKIYDDLTDEGPPTYSKQRVCIRSIHRNNFIHGLNYLVLKHLDPYKSVEEVKKFDEQIREVTDHMFSVTDWLDEEGKTLAKEKLANISSRIGYSKASLDDGLLEEFFSHMNVSDNHLENHFNEEKRATRKYIFNDTFSIDNEINVRYPLGANAYYVGDYYVLLLGLMQLPFYEYGAPKYVNFATVGSIIAHELFHGFDSLDLKREDNSTDDVNFSDEVIEAFKERKECYVNQYSQFPIDDNGTMVDGNDTIRDNIADNSAVIQALKAYEKYYTSKTEEPRLPGLDYTNQQMFFISFAQEWCEVMRDPIKELRHDLHSPGRYRVIGSLQNFPQFSEVFKCPVGSPMNPEKKCRMWG